MELISRHFRREDSPRTAGHPLRCMFVITSMPVGGAETLLVNLLRSIDRRVLLPEVICLKEPGPLGEQIQSEIPVHTGLLHGKWDLLVLPRLIRLLRQRKIDAVITVGAGDKMFWGRIAARLAGVPVVASALHSTGWPDGVGRLNRYLTPITDAFIAVADSHGQFLREFEQFPADKVCVIRNGVDCQRFAPNQEYRKEVRQQLRLGLDTPVAGIVAALRPEKNHAMLLQVAGKLRDAHPELRWLIIGDGPERDGLQSMAATLGVADRVQFMGTRSDTERILAALDLFVLCSLNEASPVSILEALACGVPVVSTNVGSVKESILEGRTGRLVPSGDVEAFSAAVHAMLTDPGVGRQMGSAGREHVCRTGSLESMVGGYQELITGLYDTKAVRKFANLSERQERVKTACMARTSGSR